MSTTETETPIHCCSGCGLDVEGRDWETAIAVLVPGGTPGNRTAEWEPFHRRCGFDQAFAFNWPVSLDPHYGDSEKPS